MRRFLTIGLIQPALTPDAAANYATIEREVAFLMEQTPRPELIIGPESIQTRVPEVIPGRQTTYFSSIAKKYGIYFIPGSIMEKSDAIPLQGYFYNSAPIFNPKGELVDVYRKMAPYMPLESKVYPGSRYVVFDIPEKKTKVGVQICYDLNFPEISRNEALMGAEILVKLTMDPVQLYKLNKYVHIVRALENQAYMISTQSAGAYGNNHLSGRSMVVSPEGDVLWEGGEVPVSICLTLDLDQVSLCRNYGSLFNDHYLQHVRDFNFPMPYADNMVEAPVFDHIITSPKSQKEKDAALAKIGITTIGHSEKRDSSNEDYIKNMDSFLTDKGF